MQGNAVRGVVRHGPRPHAGRTAGASDVPCQREPRAPAQANAFENAKRRVNRLTPHRRCAINPAWPGALAEAAVAMPDPVSPVQRKDPDPYSARPAVAPPFIPGSTLQQASPMHLRRARSPRLREPL